MSVEGGKSDADYLNGNGEWTGPLPDPVPPPLSMRAGLLLVLVPLILLCCCVVGLWRAWPSDVAITQSASAGNAAGDRPFPSAAMTMDGKPVVAPVEYVETSPDDARRRNAAIPFVKIPNPPAAPFYFSGTSDVRNRALTCLAAAAWYEAGDDAVGEAAVIQVVLNRTRHPAFPASICGVIFQGTERQTGCQFSFTCNGSLASRQPPAAAWARAWAAADIALAGYVFPLVGAATHYHTDWVQPTWSPQMAKVAQVHTHLFFRWNGKWGQPEVLRQLYSRVEQVPAKLIVPTWRGSSPVLPYADIQPSSLVAGHDEVATGSDATGYVDIAPHQLRAFDPVQNLYLLEMDPAAFPGSYAITALKLCKNKAFCRVYGWWSSADIPRVMPVSGIAMKTRVFSFQKRVGATQISQWDCNRIPRNDPRQCIAG